MYGGSQTVEQDFILDDKPRNRSRRGDVESLDFCPLENLRGDIRSVACQTRYKGDPPPPLSDSTLRMIRTRQYAAVLRNHEPDTGPYPRDATSNPPGSAGENGQVEDKERSEVKDDSVGGSDGRERVELNGTQVRLGL